MILIVQVLGTVGGPIPKTEIKVVDPDSGNVVPPGTKGSIKVRGPQVMKGYYKVCPLLLHMLIMLGSRSSSPIYVPSTPHSGRIYIMNKCYTVTFYIDVE